MSAARRRQRETGEKYTLALLHVRGTCAACLDGRPCGSCITLPCWACRESKHGRCSFDEVMPDGTKRCTECGRKWAAGEPVITFLPHADYVKSALVLDDKRLGKQRLEVRQILEALMGQSTAWANHPATLMWKGHEWQLVKYGLSICNEWVRRGFKDNVALDLKLMRVHLPECPPPAWLGREELHESHRANLVRKDAQHYGVHLGWTEEPRDGYWWPSKEGSP